MNLKTIWTWIKDKARAGEMAAIATVGGVFIFWVAPNQLEVMIYKLALIAGFAYLGYWVDRRTFPYARPHESKTKEAAQAATLRRAIIVAGAMIAGGIAL